MRLRFGLICALIIAAVFARAEQLPTLELDARYTVTRDKNTEGGEYSRTFIRWSATNADYVLIVSTTVDRVATSGEIEAGPSGGKFLFIAVGPGGTVSESITARLNARKGTGIGGVIYSLAKDFQLTTFLEDAYKLDVATGANAGAVEKAVLDVLQSLQYTVDVTKRPTGDDDVFVYTKDFAISSLLGPTAEEKAKKINVVRQVAFVVMARPRSANVWRLHIMPVVKKNYPEDNEKWSPDADGLQTSRAAVENVGSRVAAALKGKV